MKHKKIMHQFLKRIPSQSSHALLLATLLLQSCGGSSGSKTIEVDFEDTTVDSITLTNGSISSYLNKLMTSVVGSAYAGGGNLVCDVGDRISLDIQMVDNTEILFSTYCESNLELKIRRKLLESLNGHKLTRILSGAETGSDYQLNFNSGSGGANFAFDVPFRVKEFSDNNPSGVGTYTCYGDYTFNFDTGRVDQNSKTATNTLNIATNTSLIANAVGTVFEGKITNASDHFNELDPQVGGRDQFGCTTRAQTGNSLVDFRYKDGFIELDDSGQKKFDPAFCLKRASNGDIVGSHMDGVIGGDGLDCGEDDDFEPTYERWCVDDNSDGTCDT